MSTTKKLVIAGLVVAGVTAYMAYLGASSSWQYYMTVKECVDNAPKVTGRRIRVSGTIEPGSLSITADRREARFSLSEEGSKLPVVCTGTLPDDLSPAVPGRPTKAMEVVVEGRLEDSRTFGHHVVMVGDKLITRCASKYDAKKNEPTATADLRNPETMR